MAITSVNVGSAPNDGTGDTLRSAFQKLNANDSDLDGRVTSAATTATSAATAASAAQTAANNAIPTSQKGTANGVATLDASGKVPKIQIDLNPEDVGADPAGTGVSAAAALEADLSIVAKSGSYDDLIDKPTLATPVNADWDATTGLAEILNKPAISEFAKTFLDDADAAAARATLGAVASGTTVNLSGNQTIAGQKSFSDIIIPDAVKGVKGSLGGDNAQSGSIGEYIFVNTASPVAAVNNSVQTVLSFTLPAGDWELSASILYTSGGGGTNTILTIQHFMSTYNLRTLFVGTLTSGASTPIWGASIPGHRSLGATSKTVTLTSYASISAGSFTITAEIQARRVR